MKRATLILEDGTRYEGYSFGADASVSGEVVFNTAMTGYPESLTDPSYAGQIMTLTYPLVGNYGVPADDRADDGMARFLESERIHAAGMVVCDYSDEYSHWNAARSLSQWLASQGVPAITGIDTRALTKHLREQGVIRGKILVEATPEPAFEDYGDINFVERVSPRDVQVYNEGKGLKRVVLVDCGAKNNIVRCLANRGVEVVRVPWDYDFNTLDFDALFLSNGPGNPETCAVTVNNIRKFISNPDEKRPLMGICLGHQLLGKAAGADIYKLKYGHRSHNQPARLEGDVRCFVTSQNHGYAVDAKTLPADWAPWFTNMNDGSNEGIRHTSRPWRSVQFHPEACGGPVDTEFLFDEFIDQVKSL